MKKLKDEDFQEIFQDVKSHMIELAGPEEEIDKRKMADTIGMAGFIIEIIKRYQEKAFSEND